MRKIVILLGIILFMIACEKGNEEVREAKVVVVVYDENGKIATGIPVKMYNEKDYKVFEKDNLTLPTAVARTNESGIATFILPQEEWSQHSRSGSLRSWYKKVADLITTRYGLPAEP